MYYLLKVTDSNIKICSNFLDPTFKKRYLLRELIKTKKNDNEQFIKLDVENMEVVYVDNINIVSKDGMYCHQTDKNINRYDVVKVSILDDGYFYKGSIKHNIVYSYLFVFYKLDKIINAIEDTHYKIIKNNKLYIEIPKIENDDIKIPKIENDDIKIPKKSLNIDIPKKSLNIDIPKLKYTLYTS